MGGNRPQTDIQLIEMVQLASALDSFKEKQIRFCDSDANKQCCRFVI